MLDRREFAKAILAVLFAPVLPKLAGPTAQMRRPNWSSAQFETAAGTDTRLRAAVRVLEHDGWKHYWDWPVYENGSSLWIGNTESIAVRVGQLIEVAVFAASPDDPTFLVSRGPYGLTVWQDSTNR